MLKSLRAGAVQASARSWFSIQAKAEADQADVLIYDYIGWGGVTAADFAKELKAITAKTINVRINTPGGDVFDGLAIFNSLKDHGATINVKIDGIAASIGSIIAMAGHTVTMGASAFLMIHNPWAMAIGNAADMREMAATLDKIGGSLAGIYATRPGVTTEQAQAWMDAETWFTAEEAQAAGLADAVQGAGETQARAAFDLSGYAKVPAALTAPVFTPPTTPDADSVRRAALMRKRLALVERGEQSR
ncbi:MAG: head maturation protease, ClpP-related [Aestuariivirga sp.]